MIRKIVMASAIAVMPIAGLAVVGLPGVASASPAPPPPAASCTVGGSLTFPNTGLSAYGDTAKGGTSAVNLTSSSAACTGTNTNISIKTKSAKCKAPVTTASFVDAGITVYPASNIYVPQLPSGGTLPTCALVPPKKAGGSPTLSKNDEADSAWSFAGGVAVNGVQTTTASQLPAELKKGVNIVDNGVTYTLLVSTAGQISPGGACGSSDVGFALSGTVKKFTSTTWSSNVCLGADTVSGSGGSGTFLGDLTALILGTGNTTANGDAPLAATPTFSITASSIDSSESTLTIS